MGHYCGAYLRYLQPLPQHAADRHRHPEGRGRGMARQARAQLVHGLRSAARARACARCLPLRRREAGRGTHGTGVAGRSPPRRGTRSPEDGAQRPPDLRAGAARRIQARKRRGDACGRRGRALLTSGGATRPKPGLGIDRQRREGVPYSERSPEVVRPDRRPRQRPDHDHREDRDRGRPFLGAPPMRRLVGLWIERDGGRAQRDQEGDDPQRARRIQVPRKRRGDACGRGGRALLTAGGAPRPKPGLGIDQPAEGIVEKPSRQERIAGTEQEGVPYSERSPEVDRPDRRPRQRPDHDDREDRDRGRPFLGAPPMRRLVGL